MAASHLQTLRTVRPHGPYIIGGFCLGGIVAYELAQQIAASGEKVEMLLLIDASPEDKVLRATRRLCELGGRWLGWDEERQLNHFRRWWLRREQFALWRKEEAAAQAQLLFRQVSRIPSLVWKKSRPKIIDAGGPSTTAGLAHHRDVLATFLWAAAGYHAQKYSDVIVALLSEDLLHRGDHLENAWSRLAPKVIVRSLKGTHLECITAHVDNLAQTINGILTPNTAGRFAASPQAAQPALAN
jgi:thioesterase domain-containing protein